MNRIKPATPALRIILFSLTVIFFTGCSNSPKEHLFKLDNSTRVYNNAFEGKSTSGGVKFVKKQMRQDYMLRYVEFRDRVSINEAQSIDQTYLMDGKPVDLDPEDPDDELNFNEAVITMHYRMIKLPSTQLQDLIHKQHWYYDGKRWEIEPDLNPFLD